MILRANGVRPPRPPGALSGRTEMIMADLPQAKLSQCKVNS